MNFIESVLNYGTVFIFRDYETFMTATLREVTWSSIAEKVANANPRIAEFINTINPGENFPLLVGRYPYGKLFVDKGVPNLPTDDGTLVPIHDARIPKKIQELLDYSTIPLCIWLNTTGEVFVDVDNSRVPLNVFIPGSICGLWETLDSSNEYSKRTWSISVGAYTLFTLPKINDINNLKKLEKKYNFRSTVLPKTIFDQIHMFSQIANSTSVNSQWMGEILFFTKNWVTELSNKKWLEFHYFLLRNEWDSSVYWRNKVTFDLIGQMFSLAQADRNLRPSPYLIDTVMYLVAIGIGVSPGFEPIVDDETSAPIKLLQECITREYGLKTYIPTMMRPNYLSTKGLNRSVYYSLQIPTMLGSSPSLRKPHSVLDDLRMVKRLLETLQITLEKTKSPIFNLIKNVKFEFFHTEKDDFSHIKKTSCMTLHDQRLSTYHEKDRIFCETSSFLRGCVRITKVA